MEIEIKLQQALITARDKFKIKENEYTQQHFQKKTEKLGEDVEADLKLHLQAKLFEELDLERKQLYELYSTELEESLERRERGEEFEEANSVQVDFEKRGVEKTFEEFIESTEEEARENLKEACQNFKDDMDKALSEFTVQIINAIKER